MKNKTPLLLIASSLGVVGLCWWKSRVLKASRLLEKPVEALEDSYSGQDMVCFPVQESIPKVDPPRRSTAVVKKLPKARSYPVYPARVIPRSSFEKAGARLTRQLHKYTVKPEFDTKGYKKYYKHLQKEYETLQILLTNPTDTWRRIVLWGGSAAPEVSPLTPEDIIQEGVETSYTAYEQEVGVHPQGIVINPANGYTYVAGQLSNDITILDAKGEIVQTTTVPPNVYPGHNSPVALAVYDRGEHENYGKVYVVGSVANTVSILSLELKVIGTIPVGVRPVAIAFSPVTMLLYVANHQSGRLSVIDTETQSVVATLTVEKQPSAIAIDPSSGKLFVANSGSGSISVFTSDHSPITPIVLSSDPDKGAITSLVIVPESNSLFAVLADQNKVVVLDLETHEIKATTTVGVDPYSCIYNTHNGFVYVGNRGDHTLSVLDGKGLLLGTIQRDHINIGMAFDPKTGSIVTSNTSGNTVSGIGFKKVPTITISENYPTKQDDFIYNPAYIKHVKFVLSGKERFNTLTLAEDTITGSQKSEPLSFSTHSSPQNFGNVSELFELENTILDGRHRWIFKIAPHQTITILIYYYQIDRYKVYNEVLEKQER